MRSALRRALLLAPLGLCASCLQLTWERHLRFKQPAPAAVEALVVGEADLAASLERLGAPLFVWALPADSCALAWGWFESAELGFDASVPVADQSASFSYDDIDERLQGLVLVFDSGRTLVQTRRGYLADLRSSLRGAPAYLDEEDDPWPPNLLFPD